MSITVAIDDLASALAGRSWGYLVTVGPDLRVHLVAVPTDLRDGVLHVAGGRSSTANAAAHPEVTMVFPPTGREGMSLIVDGNASVADDRLEVRPSAAVLHRPAPEL
jgi:hypothetical protein